MGLACFSGQDVCEGSVLRRVTRTDTDHTNMNPTHKHILTCEKPNAMFTTIKG